MTQYKLGDRVNHERWGDGTIIEYNSDFDFLVEYDNYNDMLHDGNNCGRAKGKKGHCWWVNYIDNKVIKIDDTKLKVGDRVKPVNAGVYDRKEGRNRKTDEIGTIIDIKNWGREYLVEYDDKIKNGHGGGFPVGKIKGKSGHCWWEYGSSLKKTLNKPQVYIVYECAEMRHQRTLNAIILAGGRIHAVKDNKEAAKTLKAKLETETKNYIAILTFDIESK